MARGNGFSTWKLVAADVYTHKSNAAARVAYLRDLPDVKVQTFERNVRAGGESFTVYCVVARKRPEVQTIVPAPKAE